MAQKAGYQGIKKLNPPIDITSEGTLFIEEGYYQKTELSEPVEGQSTVEGALGALSSKKVGWDVAGKSVKKNEVDVKKAIANNVLLQIISTGIRLYNTVSSTWNRAYIPLNLSNDTNYILSSNITFVSGAGQIYVQGSNDGTNYTDITDATAFYANKNVDVEFNSDDYVYYRLGLVSSRATATIGDITFGNLMIRDARIANSTYAPFIYDNTELEAKKADNTVIAPVEDGTTVQNPSGYAVGSHAIRNGAFITWKNAKAQGETITDSDYDSGDVADLLDIVRTTITTTNTNVTLDNDYKTVHKIGRIAQVMLRFTLSADIGNENVTIATLPYNSLKLLRVPVFLRNIPNSISASALVAGGGNNLQASNLTAGTYDISFMYITSL